MCYALIPQHPNQELQNSQATSRLDVFILLKRLHQLEDADNLELGIGTSHMNTLGKSLLFSSVQQVAMDDAFDSYSQQVSRFVGK